MNWWTLGQNTGIAGAGLALNQITCAFCDQRGEWARVHHVHKKKPNEQHQLNFDTYQCGRCAGYVMVLWGTSGLIHDYRVLPHPTPYTSHPKHWPPEIGRYWLQAKRNLAQENWDAAAVMATSALQLAFRSKGAQGSTLNQETKDLVTKGILPPIMSEWADEVRELRNTAAHPGLGQEATSAKDANDVVQFLDFLLRYLIDLPHQIEEYRKRKQPPETKGQ
jgi:hypothetical protein